MFCLLYRTLHIRPSQDWAVIRTQKKLDNNTTILRIVQHIFH